ncbi:MAG: hypothetical protein LBI57_01520 [Helicobacteraceae bacterium]|nr:hypothetical protein [Helicobacteraceae bacterium]
MGAVFWGFFIVCIAMLFYGGNSDIFLVGSIIAGIMAFFGTWIIGGVTGLMN